MRECEQAAADARPATNATHGRNRYRTMEAGDGQSEKETCEQLAKWRMT